VAALLQLAGDRIRFRKGWFFLFYLLAGIGYLTLTGPFRVPDERNHFFRSYEVSEGRLLAYRVSGSYPGDSLPSSLARLSEALGNHADNYIQPAQLEQARSVTLAPEKREFMEFATSAIYSPLVYLPSAFSVALGRAMGASPFALVYFARAGNLLVGAWLISLALSHAGFARRAALLVALFPMTISQVSSVSADAMTYSLSFLWIAVVMELVVGKGEVASRKKILGLVGLALALSQLRPPFPLLGLLVFLMPLRRFGLKRAALICAAVAAASILPGVAWNARAAPLFVNPKPNEDVDPARQGAWVAYHPAAFWQRVKYDLARNALDYGQELVGRLGWRNIELPPWIPIGYAVALGACFFLGPRDPPYPAWWQRLGLALVIFGGLVAIELSQYLSFSAVRSAFILGVQGRYFTPFAFLTAFAFSNSLLNRKDVETAARIACAALVIGAHLCAFFVLARVAGKI
jgi:hypothetical protein